MFGEEEAEARQIVLVSLLGDTIVSRRRGCSYPTRDSAAIEVTVTTPPSSGLNGFRFVSDATTASHFAQIGHDQNGAFFPG